jgi:8-oxo-dGTP diphosphatase
MSKADRRSAALPPAAAGAGPGRATTAGFLYFDRAAFGGGILHHPSSRRSVARSMSSAHRYRFCPLCATPLESRDDHGSPRPTCPSCGYVHYRNPAPAAGVLLARGGEVLLVKRAYAPRAGAWCLPAGFMEYGETPEHCAVRELREETGIEARLTGLHGVYAGVDDPRVRAVLIVYTAERAGGRLTPGDDAIDARFHPLRALPRAIAFAAHRRALEEFRRAGGGS